MEINRHFEVIFIAEIADHFLDRLNPGFIPAFPRRNWKGL